MPLRPFLGLVLSAKLLLASQAHGQWDWGKLPEIPWIDGFNMAWDPDRARVVLFGGVVQGNPPVYLDETWEWDGGRWVVRSTPIAPPSRAHAAMAWDPVNRSVLLFGGKGGAGTLNDTWLYDGRSWRQAASPAAPGPRVAHRMATDPIRGRVVLFGGFPDTPFGLQPALQDTWEWDGLRWNQRFPSSFVPARRGGHAMAFHANSGRVAMFGGGDGPWRLPTLPLLEWDGMDWIQVPGSGSLDPGLLCFPDGTPDPVTGGLILYGGYGSSGARDSTFRWNNGSWSLLTGGNTPAGPRVSTDPAEMDMARRELVTFGRVDLSVRSQQDESTWVLDIAQSTWRSAHDYLRIPTRDIVFDTRRDGFWVILWIDIRTPQMWWLTDEGYELVPAQPPYPLLGTMAYHEPSGLVMMYDSLSGTTWTWNGSTWSSYQYSSSPPSSGFPSYHPGGQRVLYYVDQMVWAWQPTGWTLLTPRNPSLPRLFRTSHVAYDAGRSRLVVIGEDPNQPGTGGLWEWDGSSWTRSLASFPSGLEGRLLCHVPDFGGLMLVGGRPGEWLWNGTLWSLVSFSGSPPSGLPYGYHASAYDPNRRRLRLLVWVHGQQQQIWDLAHRSLTVSRPDPNPGDLLTFAMDAAGEAGKPWLLGLSTGRYPGIPLRPGRYYGTELLPLAHDWLLPISLTAGLGGVLDVQGRGQTVLWVPATSALLGLSFHAAAGTFGPGLSIDHVSAGVALTIVP